MVSAYFKVNGEDVVVEYDMVCMEMFSKILWILDAGGIEDKIDVSFEIQDYVEVSKWLASQIWLIDPLRSAPGIVVKIWGIDFFINKKTNE